MCEWGTDREVTIERRITVDACLADTIVALNRAGVSTTGCCCGHGKPDAHPTATILPSAQDRAQALGYTVRLSPSGEPTIRVHPDDAVRIGLFLVRESALAEERALDQRLAARAADARPAGAACLGCGRPTQHVDATVWGCSHCTGGPTVPTPPAARAPRDAGDAEGALLERAPARDAACQVCAECHTDAAPLRALAAELPALREDAARHRWLRTRLAVSTLDGRPYLGPSGVTFTDGTECLSTSRDAPPHDLGHGADVDAHVDAARRAPEPSE